MNALSLLKRYWPFITVVLIAGFLRFYRIDYHFSTNGADEGIQLMAGRLFAEGHDMYTQINSVQAPLFLWIYSLLHGNITAARSLSALFSLSGIVAAMLIGHRMGNKRIALLAGLFMAFNQYYVKEGRLASLDLFCSVFLLWAFYFLIVSFCGERISPWKIALSGILFSLACMTKLFGVIPLMGVSTYLIWFWIKQLRADRNTSRITFYSLAAFGFAIIATTLLIMSVFGIVETFVGIFLNNLDRPSQSLEDKLHVLGNLFLWFFIPVALSVLAAFRFRTGKNVQLLLAWAVPLSLFFIFQSLTWIHHLTILVPPLALLGAVGADSLLSSGPGTGTGTRTGKDQTTGTDRTGSFSDPPSTCERSATVCELENRNTSGFGNGRISSFRNGSMIPKNILSDRKILLVLVVVVIFVLVQAGIGFGQVLTAERPVEYAVADEMKKVTDGNEFVIAGDPLIALRADRNQVPEACNLAWVRSTPLPSTELINLTEQYDVSAVVLTYNLSHSDGYVEYVLKNYQFHGAWDGRGKFSDVEGDIEIDRENFHLYIRP